MEKFEKRTESQRKNKEDYEKKNSKESGEEGDSMKEEGEKMIADFMAKKRNRLLTRLENEKDIINKLIDFEKQNLIDAYKEKKEFAELKKKLKINSNEIDEFLFN